jgi:hypothetical protein
LTPRIQSILPEIRNLLQRAVRRPTRLAIWITAAIAAVVMAVSACAALPAVSVSGMAGGNHAKNVGESGRAGAPAADAADSARSGPAKSGKATRHTATGHRTHHAASRVRAASAGHSAASAGHSPKLRPRAAAVGHARHGEHRAQVHVRTADRHRTRHQHRAIMAPTLHRGVSHRKQGSHEAAPATAARPYLIYDSVTPSSIPAGRAAAVYATGSYAAQPSEVAGHRPVLWIDTSGSDPGASVLDVEPGDATPAIAADWARRRLSANPHGLARLYTMRSEWPSVQAAVSSLSSWMRSRIRYWIADPTGSPHIVPGSDATQWYWGSHYDITTATPRF